MAMNYTTRDCEFCIAEKSACATIRKLPAIGICSALRYAHIYDNSGIHRLPPNPSRRYCYSSFATSSDNTFDRGAWPLARKHANKAKCISQYHGACAYHTFAGSLGACMHVATESFSGNPTTSFHAQVLNPSFLPCASRNYGRSAMRQLHATSTRVASFALQETRLEGTRVRNTVARQITQAFP